MRQNKIVTKYERPYIKQGTMHTKNQKEVRQKAIKPNKYIIGARITKEYWKPFMFKDRNQFERELYERALDCDINNAQLDNFGYLGLDFSFYIGKYLVKITEKDDTLYTTEYILTTGDPSKPGIQFTSRSFKTPRMQSQVKAMYEPMMEAYAKAIHAYKTGAEIPL